MADAKLSSFPTAGALTGAESIPLLQGGINVLSTVGALTTFGASGSDSVNLLATETLPAFVVVTATGARADSSNLAHMRRVLGITRAAIANGFVGSVASDGEVVNPAWAWNRGDVLYLNGTDLSTTPAASGFLQRIAVAQASTIVTMELEPSILI